MFKQSNQSGGWRQLCAIQQSQLRANAVIWQLILSSFWLQMPALDLKCITKLKAMQQRPIAAFEGHLHHIDQMRESLDFLNLPIPQ